MIDHDRFFSQKKQSSAPSPVGIMPILCKSKNVNSENPPLATLQVRGFCKGMGGDFLCSGNSLSEANTLIKEKGK